MLFAFRFFWSLPPLLQLLLFLILILFLFQFSFLCGFFFFFAQDTFPRAAGAVRPAGSLPRRSRLGTWGYGQVAKALVSVTAGAETPSTLV